ncbi:tellurite resistance TerB family protein [Candidatus Laterigemmans baculatus]|uniref:tellurite resistance TerB family protein n=1 Tax=Candidatus Laterigemmans baculatus TaxID=2770505 RepID=UPI0013D97054|nr:TerB family tellurite resistance protein [Candidatus Laterigemmans baculatus]
MQQIEQLKNLVVMAVADGSLGEPELALLAERCCELGLDENQLQTAIAFGLSNQAAIQLPQEPAEQEALLADLMRMMAADGRLSEPEKRLFSVAAAKMNFDASRVNELIDRLTHCP